MSGHSNAKRTAVDQERNQAPPANPRNPRPKLENTDNTEKNYTKHNKSTSHQALAMDALPFPNRNRPCGRH